ncbi:cell envelope biogenesis protein OmpA [Polaribacter reichenbachii]|uniref:Cell envelope biogenesis protein OmpA n=1 Tax=Polaribacter reichenbachii TaxID=996801 RepID=A0A1B8TRY9_9FLAO|nr:OmpA family protein [Polaribacter reichenbachii]APZ44936.1 cell envelope biogenesis protein OmpA [Polaribacter reichenbachii]AUC18799.1 cell envelope biogenesis protein OmpA [Polaribacter reichenbachii]OBY62370.1 cell envelope biogenesis protein OmpA [Polaribacter reichenbachii]
MKKIYFGAVFTLLSFLTQAQEDFDHWSIDIGGGLHQIGSTITPGYSANILGQGSMGFRYMFNEKFGLRLDLGYNSFSADENSTADFKSNYYRASLEGVVNLGNLLNFKSFTNRFNLLAHVGAGAASLNVTEPTDNGGDLMYVMNVGLTPQFKLSNRFSIFLDFNSLIHYNQEDNFDGGANTSGRESNISLMNTSIGLNIALGRNKQSADFWNEELDEEVIDGELVSLKKRLDSAEKEIAILKTKESGPNKELIMTELDERYVKKNEINKYANVVSGSNVDFIRNLLNSGYINVYFDTNKTKIQEGSLNSVNYLKQFMIDNPYVNAELIGYADETGTVERNKTLSQNRAKMVFDVLVAAGINPTRLSYFGGGEDTSVAKDARQLARKVTFKIK